MAAEPIPQLELEVGHVLDRTSVVYGPSGTGKTVIVKHVMAMLRGHIDQCIVVSPSEPSNRSYEGYVPPQLVHYQAGMRDPKKKDTERAAGLRFLDSIWRRQEMAAAIYNRVNRRETLAALYARLPPAARRATGANLASLERVRRGQLGGAAGDPEERRRLTERYDQIECLIYKRAIAPHVDALARGDLGELTEDERYCAVYLTYNPRLLLIFDDCAAELKPFFAKEVFRLLFYQNRHVFTTVLICCQDDTDLPANLRKNAYVSFYTTAAVCDANFKRASNNFPRATKDFIDSVTPWVYEQKGGGRHRKLAYIREDPRRQHFYHFTARKHAPFMFCSPAVVELCERVKSDGAVMDRDNPYFDAFRL